MRCKSGKNNNVEKSEKSINLTGNCKKEQKQWVSGQYGGSWLQTISHHASTALLMFQAPIALQYFGGGVVVVEGGTVVMIVSVNK